MRARALILLNEAVKKDVLHYVLTPTFYNSSEWKFLRIIYYLYDRIYLTNIILKIATHLIQGNRVRSTSFLAKIFAYVELSRETNYRAPNLR